MGFGIGHQVAQAPERRIRRRDDREIEVTEGRYRREIAQRVVRQGLEQPGADGRGVGDQQQRVAIGLGLGNGIAGHHAAGAGLVVHDDRLPQRFAELLRDGARGQVRNAARAEGNDDPDRPRGKGLRHGGQGQHQDGTAQHQEANRIVHFSSTGIGFIEGTRRCGHRPGSVARKPALCAGRSRIGRSKSG